MNEARLIKPQQRAPDPLEGVWKSLANAARREILDLLVEGPRPTGWLAEQFPEISRFAVMQHLRVLEEGGLVIRRKVGRETQNYLNPVPIQQIYHRWVARFQEPWAEALVSLKHGLEREEHLENQQEDLAG